MNRYCWIVALAGLLVGCSGGRTKSGNPAREVSRDRGTTPDRTSLSDGVVTADRSVPRDRTVADPFCSGGNRVQLNGNALTMGPTTSGIDYLANCCGPGEFVGFSAKDKYGKTFKFSLEIVRFPDTPWTSHIDLAHLAKGWVVVVRCDPYQQCGFLRFDNAAFVGTLDMALTSTFPAVHLSLCTTITPLKGANPGFSSMKLALNNILVNRACVPGINQTCNTDPKISVLHGTCNKNSTCSCSRGSVKIRSSGKCH